jgi:solute:Na+ symporter, SSS family
VRVKDEKHARRMVLLLTLPNAVLLMPLWMQLPAMCAAVVFPDMKAVFPHLKNPEEAAWVAMSFKVLPNGLLGLMVCGMFSAAIDSLDAGLNTNAGFFVRNVYTRYMRTKASDKEQVLVGKAVTVLFGVLMVGVGLAVNSLRSLNLFDFFQLFNAMVLPPMMVPMALGLIIKRTPPWSGWSTMLIGTTAAVIAKTLYTPELAQHALGYLRVLNVREVIDSQFIFVGVITFGVSTLWFLSTMFFYRGTRESDRQRVEALFVDFARPIDRVAEGDRDQDSIQYQIIGYLCMILGGFLLACMLIPNPLRGRMAFLFIGGTLSSLGFLLWCIYRRKLRQAKGTPSLKTASTESVLTE